MADTVADLYRAMIEDPKYQRALYLSKEANTASLLANHRGGASRHADAAKANAEASNAWQKLKYSRSAEKAKVHDEIARIHHARSIDKL